MFRIVPRVRVAHSALRPVLSGRVGSYSVRSLATESIKPVVDETKPATETPKAQGSIGSRFTGTLEVTISKLFPAGFGWQAGSIVAADMGMKATDTGFFLITGLGDMTGVFLGHSIYYGLKSVFVKDVSLAQEVLNARPSKIKVFCLQLGP